MKHFLTGIPWNCVRYGHDQQKTDFKDIPPGEQGRKDYSQSNGRRNGVYDMAVVDNADVSIM